MVSILGSMSQGLTCRWQLQVSERSIQLNALPPPAKDVTSASHSLKQQEPLNVGAETATGQLTATTSNNTNSGSNSGSGGQGSAEKAGNAQLATEVGVELESMIFGVHRPAIALSMRRVPAFEGSCQPKGLVLAAGGSAPGSCVLQGAGLTDDGKLALFHVRKGALQPLELRVDAAFDVHGKLEGRTGVCWTGPLPYIVSFCCRKANGGNVINSLILTHVTSRQCWTFREAGPEAAQLRGVRASPSGRHLLLLFRGAPGELWALQVMQGLGGWGGGLIQFGT